LSTYAGIGELKQVVSADQVERRVRELARQIEQDYAGRTLHVVGVLEAAFIFMSDLIRDINLPVVCHFVRPDYKDYLDATHIFFSPEPDVKGEDVLLVRGLVHSGVTTEFLVRMLSLRGAASVKIAALLDRPSGHRVAIQPDYFGFLVDETYVFGYGLSGPGDVGRNLSYIASVAR